MEESVKPTCKNCTSPLNGLYCSHCGQKSFTDRLSLQQIIKLFFAQLTNIEKGFTYTIIQLFKAPEKVIRDYLSGVTVKYYNPFRYLLLWATVSALVIVFTGVFDQQQNEINDLMNRAPTETQGEIRDFVQSEMKKYLSFVSILTVPFMAIIASLIFKKRNWNFAEHLVSLAFIVGHLSLLGIIGILINLMLPFSVAYHMPLSFAIGIGYFAFVYKRLFQLNWARAILVGIAVHSGGILFLVTITFIVFSIGVFVYLLLFKKA